MTASRQRRWTADRLLIEAGAWGDMLCRDAYWHGERCSWVGHSPDEAPQEGPLVCGVASLGPDFYSGTAGVALFLAQLHALVPKPTYRDTALGAIRHAAHHAEGIQPDVGIGLHTGALGVGFASGRVGQLLGVGGLAADGVQLARRAVAQAGDRPFLDFVSGSSSAICVLLIMSRWRDGDSLLECADVLGRDIVTRGNAADGRWSWSNADVSGGTQWARPLNGLAHGAAGVGIALLELFARTRRAEYRTAGLGAFAYEDQYVNEADGNWEDLRVETRPSVAVEVPGHTMAWCHGAPGIVLTRLRAAQLVPEHGPDLQRTIMLGLRGAAAHAESQLKSSAFDVTSCHGLAGNIEPFVMAAHILQEPAHLQRARDLWREAFRRRDDGATWMSGVGTGARNPSLMLGMAGLGYGLLRAFDPARVPSILLPHPA